MDKLKTGLAMSFGSHIGISKGVVTLSLVSSSGITYVRCEGTTLLTKEEEMAYLVLV